MCHHTRIVRRSLPAARCLRCATGTCCTGVAALQSMKQSMKQPENNGDNKSLHSNSQTLQNYSAHCQQLAPVNSGSERLLTNSSAPFSHVQDAYTGILCTSHFQQHPVRRFSNFRCGSWLHVTCTRYVQPWNV